MICHQHPWGRVRVSQWSNDNCKTGLESQVDHLFPVHLWESGLTSWRLSFLICKMELISFALLEGTRIEQIPNSNRIGSYFLVPDSLRPECLPASWVILDKLISSSGPQSPHNSYSYLLCSYENGVNEHRARLAHIRAPKVLDSKHYYCVWHAFQTHIDCEVSLHSSFGRCHRQC
jgi:hypothetical protein